MSKNTPAQESLQLATPDGTTTNVEKYEFEPIKGYPMLNWRGKRPFTSTQYYPAQLKEVHGDEVDGWRNKIFWGDNLQVMSHLLKQYRSKVDLIYIDPPFDSKADYKKRIEVEGRLAESSAFAFEEKQYSDIWNNDEYLQFLYERFIVLRELLSPEGSIWIHCDWHKSHYIRLMCDEIFGSSSFINEIIWKRKGGSAGDQNRFGIVTDTIFAYGKTGDYRFNKPYARDTPEAAEYIKERFTKKYQDRLYMPAPIERNAALGLRENLRYEYNGYTPQYGWMMSLEKLRAMDERGRLEWNSKGKPVRRVFLDEYEGQPVENLWTDIYVINPMAQERLNYPTQKPEALVERIIKASTQPGDLVFDCFMGSGTTQAVSMKHGRRFIGADINLGAIQTTAKRLIGVSGGLRQKRLEEDAKHYTGFELYNVNHYDIFRNPAQAKELLIEALEVRKLEFSTVFDGEKDGRMVKIMPVNRIATRADLNELIAGFDYKAWERKQNESPNRPVEKITLVCMGHEPTLRAELELAAKPFKIDVEVVDILRDKADLEFKRDSQAKVSIKKGELVIEKFYPMNLLQKLSLQKESVQDWKELAESVLIDWNYDGAVLQPAVVDIPGKNEMVKGAYKVPDDAGTIRVKITDLLSESWEGSVANGD